MNDDGRGEAADRGGPYGVPVRRTGPAHGADPLIPTGRADELAALDAVAHEALAGRMRAVQLEGGAGTGKSTLLHHWLDTVPDFRVLRARCCLLQRDVAFGTARRLLHPLLAAAGAAERRSLLADAGEAVARLLGPEEPGGDDGGPHPDGTVEVLAGLDRLVLRLAREHPLLLAIDDLQWVDPLSLRWLARLVNRTDAYPVLVAVTTRTGERPDPGALFTDLVHPATCRTLTLRPLTPADVEALVAAEFGVPRPDPSFCTACHAATQGHPLFLRALLGDARSNGLRPTHEDRDKIADLSLSALVPEIGHWLSQGSSTLTELARGIAILGDGMPRALLAAYCGTGKAVLRSAERQLRSLGVLREGEDLRFIHHVVREAVLAQWSPQEVGAAHARAAQVLHLSGRPAEETAAHITAAGPLTGTWALTVLHRAADEALRRGAAETAVAYLRHALFQPAAPTEQAQVLLHLADAASYYDTALAASYGSAALEGLTDESARCAALGILAYSHLLSPGSHSGPLGLQRLSAELTARTSATSGDRELLLRTQALIEWLEFEHPATRTAFAASHPVPDAAPHTASHAVARPVPDAVPDGVLGGGTLGERQLLAIRAFTALRAGRPAEEVTALVDQARANLPAFSHSLFPLHSFVGQSLLYLDRLDEAGDLCTRLLRETQDSGRDLLATYLLIFRAAVALRRGDIAQAATVVRTASERAGATAVSPCRTTLDIITVDTLIEQGDLQAAERAAAGYSAAALAETSWEGPRMLMSLATLRTAQGDPRSGLALLRESSHHFETAGIVNPAIVPWRSRAAGIRLLLGDTRTAQALAEQELELARECRIPRAVGVALVASANAHAATTARGPERGTELLAEAIGVLERTPALLELARALHAFAGALLRRDDKSGARKALRRAGDIAARCGAFRLAGRVQQRLHDAGGRVTGRETDGGSTLTAGEERVAVLAAAGMSNREIAECLFVSLRTVETHLTATYRKLGIGGRPELAAEMAALTGARGQGPTPTA
ncbi:AAA family ATPase [Streptomyces rimosus]|uniref:helix-turn-helix transcriptional regulator n=1 Tax=Streptomyces rimosus TaxID=1927 RepID=UPI00099BECB8|nr:AAA family ATPase [Streptomyces rimosus]